MAGLTKTYTGDLTQAIAGKIWSVIKEEDEKRKIEDSEASKEVKDAAKKLLKEDKDSIPVKDRDLRDTLANIFIPVETKLSKTKATTDSLSAKITSIGGSIADTQNLIINQNQILEEKLDRMLQVIGDENVRAILAEEQSKFNQLELGIEGISDVADTFGMGSSLLGGEGINTLKNLLDEFARPLMPFEDSRLLRVFRGRFFSKIASFLPARMVARIFNIPINKVVDKKALYKSLYRTYAPGGISPTMKQVMKKTKTFTSVTGEVVKPTIIPKATHQLKVSKKYVQKGVKNVSGVWSQQQGTDALSDAIFRGMDTDEAIAKQLGKKVTKKTLANAPARFGRKLRDSILVDILSSPKAKERLIKQLGKEGVEKLGTKAAQGAFKTTAPLIGTAWGAVEGVARLLMGDPKGMMLSFGSAIPVAGWGFTVLDIIRDIDRDAYNKHIEPNLPMVSDKDFARFFIDAAGITPDMYERGSGHISPVSLGIGNSIEQIVGATLAIGKAAGIDTKSLVTDAGLGSVNPRGTFSFDISSNVSGTSEPTSKMVRDRELPQIRKKKKTQQEILEDKNNKETIEEKKTQDSRWLLDPRRHFNFGNKSGEGGIGGDPVSATDTIAGDGTVIEFWGQQGKDRSGEPGVDFSFRDYKSNYNLFPGTVLETGLLYGARYGNVVVVRSIDPSNGQEFDALYSHFPDGGMDVKPGQQVGAGQYLGKVGFVSVDTPGVPQMQPNNAGNMSGWHTSVDFFEPGSAARYENANAIINLVTSSNGQKPSGLLQKLTPPVKKEEDITPPPLPPISNNLDNIDGGKSLVSQAISNGSMERLVKKRNSAVSVPIIVNNQVAASSPSSSIQISSGGGNGIGWEQMQSARLGVA